MEIVKNAMILLSNKNTSVIIESFRNKIDPKDSSKLQTIDNEKPKVSYKWKDSTVELVSGPGIMKLTLYCLWEVRAQKACSIFYSQLNDRYPIQKSNGNKK